MSPNTPPFGSEDDQRWQATDPRTAAKWLAATTRPWWIGGGWAIDLFLGETTRAHRDLDVGILRRDEQEVRRAFPQWEFASAFDGRLDPLPDDEFCPLVSHSIWCRQAGSEAWALELVLEEADGEGWVYRRDARIRRSVSGISLVSESGLPILAPEIELLYKSKAIRPKDLHDFRAVAPRLSIEARRWLAHSLGLVEPLHPWTAELERIR